MEEEKENIVPDALFEQPSLDDFDDFLTNIASTRFEAAVIDARMSRSVFTNMTSITY